MTDKLNKEELGCAVVVLGFITAIVIFIWVKWIESGNEPIKKYTPPVVVEAPKPTIITKDQWEKLNTKLLMDDYHWDYIRRDTIKDFISMNKSKVEQAVKEMGE